MVFYFTTVGTLCLPWLECAYSHPVAVEGTKYYLYMGKDKYENEDLIKYGWSDDLWFHVDKLSSAHVYVRLPEVILLHRP